MRTQAAAALVGPDGVIASYGELDRRFRWASVTKLVTATAVLSAVIDRALAFVTDRPYDRGPWEPGQRSRTPSSRRPPSDHPSA